MVTADAVEASAGVATLDQEFPHERHVHDDDVLPGCLMFVLPTIEPGRSPPCQSAWVRLFPGRAIPGRAFPTAHLFKVGTRGRQAIVKWGSAHVPGSGVRHPGVMTLVDHPKRLNGALAPILGVGLVDLEAIDVETGHVNVRLPSNDPVRQHSAEATASQHTDGVQPGCHEVAPEAPAPRRR